MRKLSSVIAAGVITAAAAAAALSTTYYVAHAQAPTPAPAEAPAAAPDPLLAELLAEGEALFEKNCAPCHGSDFAGGEGPRLASNRNVGGDGVVAQMMILGGGYMPAFGRLNNRQMAAIATYVRNTHGNEYGLVTEEEIAADR